MNFSDPVYKLLFDKSGYVSHQPEPVFTAKSSIRQPRTDNILSISFYPDGHICMTQSISVFIPGKGWGNPGHMKTESIDTHMMIPLGGKYRYKTMDSFVEHLYADLIEKEYTTGLSEADQSTVGDLSTSWPRHIDPLKIRESVRNSSISGRTLGLTMIPERPPSFTDLRSRHGREYDPVSILGMGRSFIINRICGFEQCGGRLFKISADNRSTPCTNGANRNDLRKIIHAPAKYGIGSGELSISFVNSFITSIRTAANPITETVITITGDNSAQGQKIPAEQLGLEFLVLAELPPSSMRLSAGQAQVTIRSGFEKCAEIAMNTGLLSRMDADALRREINRLRTHSMQPAKPPAAKITTAATAAAKAAAKATRSGNSGK